MVRNLQVSEDLHQRLVRLAQERGICDVELLLEQLLPPAELASHAKRQALVERIHERRQQLLAQCGVMTDSVDLLREDRDR